MRPARIKTKALAFLLAGTAVHAEVKTAETLAINQYISERKKIQANAAPVVEKLGSQALVRLGEMEKRIFPISVWVDGQVATMIAEEASLERRNKELKEQEKFNPYDDKQWKETAHKNLVQLCCDIKADPRWQQQVINRVAQGLPALMPPGQRRGGGAGANAGQANGARAQGMRQGSPPANRGQRGPGQGGAQMRQGRPQGRGAANGQGRGGGGRKAGGGGGGGQGRGRRGGG